MSTSLRMTLCKSMLSLSEYNQRRESAHIDFKKLLFMYGFMPEEKWFTCGINF